MNLKRLTDWNHRALIVDADRVIVINENAPRREYDKTPTGGTASTYKEHPCCTVALDGECCGSEGGQGYAVLGTVDEIVDQLGFSIL